MMTDGEYGRLGASVWRSECHSTMARPGNEPAKCRLTAFPYYHGMLLEPVDYLVLLIGTLASTGWGFVLLGLS